MHSWQKLWCRNLGDMQHTLLLTCRCMHHYWWYKNPPVSYSGFTLFLALMVAWQFSNNSSISLLPLWAPYISGVSPSCSKQHEESNVWIDNMCVLEKQKRLLYGVCRITLTWSDKFISAFLLSSVWIRAAFSKWTAAMSAVHPFLKKKLQEGVMSWCCEYNHNIPVLMLAHISIGTVTSFWALMSIPWFNNSFTMETSPRQAAYMSTVVSS